MYANTAVNIEKEGIDFMSRKNDVDEMRGRLARLNERSKSAESELKRLEEKRKKVQNLIAEEERKKRTHNLCCVGGLVYKYFGEDISLEEFKEMLDFLFAIEDVRDFVAEKKEKRFLRNNSTIVISENTNLAKTENNKVENA